MRLGNGEDRGNHIGDIADTVSKAIAAARYNYDNLTRVEKPTSLTGGLVTQDYFRVLGENGRIIFRADAYNALNHANLGSPAAFLNSKSNFGLALFGARQQGTGVPTLIPLQEGPRQVQLLIRLEF